MRIEERIGESSAEHYALFALDRYDEHHSLPVDVATLHAATDEYFPSDQRLLDALMELSTRGLVENTTDGWTITAPGRTAIKRRAMPEHRPPWHEPDATDLGDDELEDAAVDDLIPPPTEWEETGHAGVYTHGPELPDSLLGTSTPELVDMAASILDSLPEEIRDDWNFVCSSGPRRFYDVAYGISERKRAIRLDGYSGSANVEAWAGPLKREVVNEILSIHKWETDSPEVE